jgi:hypothetical protein
MIIINDHEALVRMIAERTGEAPEAIAEQLSSLPNDKKEAINNLAQAIFKIADTWRNEIDLTATELRWKAAIDFRNGSKTVATFEEIGGILGDVVERGPNWNEIDQIVITLNRRSDDKAAA